MKIVSSSSSGGGVNRILLLLTYFPPDYGNSLPTLFPPHHVQHTNLSYLQIKSTELIIIK